VCVAVYVQGIRRPLNQPYVRPPNAMKSSMPSPPAAEGVFRRRRVGRRKQTTATEGSHARMCSKAFSGPLN